MAPFLSSLVTCDDALAAPRERVFLPMLLRLSHILLFVLMGVLPACATTTEPVSTTKSGKKAYDSCVCGPLLSPEGESHCAIWERSAATKILKGEPLATCNPADCSRLFSPFCQKIEMAAQKSPPPLPPEVAQGCYCDLVLHENERGQVKTLCAAWAEGGANLIEYYPLEECPPTRCREAPFRIAKTVCKEVFRPFYQTPKPRP